MAGMASPCRGCLDEEESRLSGRDPHPRARLIASYTNKVIVASAAGGAVALFTDPVELHGLDRLTVIILFDYGWSSPAGAPYTFFFDTFGSNDLPNYVADGPTDAVPSPGSGTISNQTAGVHGRWERSRFGLEISSGAPLRFGSVGFSCWIWGDHR